MSGWHEELRTRQRIILLAKPSLPAGFAASQQRPREGPVYLVGIAPTPDAAGAGAAGAGTAAAGAGVGVAGAVPGI